MYMSHQLKTINVTLHCTCYSVSPEYDEVHAIFALIVVLHEALLCHLVHRLSGRYFLVHSLIRVQIRVHVVSEHQIPQISFNQLYA